ncbi:hypothetical protein L7F22_044281 [Adiantum nelumboides]|nr:hypothetical protein [Adiantum nelumboides]
MLDQLAYQHQFSKKLIIQRKEEIRQLGVEGIEETLNDSSDILTLLLRANMLDDAKHKIDDEMMCNQITNILGAGHETTASCACWTLWLLATHQEEQERLRAECLSLLETDQEPDWSKIKDLEYLDGVVKESLRIHPPTPRVARICPKDSVIDGVIIPKGTMLLSANNVINRDKFIWGEDADSFKPTRWKSENIPTNYDARFSMMTFLAGPHACIGKQMAIMELKAVLLGLIGKFKFEVSSLQPDVTPSE